MPEVRFQIRWPDGKCELGYSPSTVIFEYLDAGKAYPLAEFVALSEAALLAASERVRQIHGVPCNRALAQLQSLQTTAEHQPEGLVDVVSMT